MSRRAKIATATSVLGLATIGVSGCGSANIKVARSAPTYAGAELFVQRCSGCHTLGAAGANGSAEKLDNRQRINGPNFNSRPETMAQVLYAIENGGFTGATMPQNIVVGPDAQAVAQFLSKYAGSERSTASSQG
jgi:mono/diheme cytochrome c family protein